MAQGRAQAVQLVQIKGAVKNIAADQTELPLQIQGRQDLPRRLIFIDDSEAF